MLGWGEISFGVGMGLVLELRWDQCWGWSVVRVGVVKGLGWALIWNGVEVDPSVRSVPYTCNVVLSGKEYILLIPN